MRKELSQILILLLLVLSPVSYSSVEIPDFSTETPLTEMYQVRAAVAAIDGSPRQESPPPEKCQTEVAFAAASSLVPHAVCLSNPCSGRAPPL